MCQERVIYSERLSFYMKLIVLSVRKGQSFRCSR